MNWLTQTYPVQNWILWLLVSHVVLSGVNGILRFIIWMIK